MRIKIIGFQFALEQQKLLLPGFIPSIFYTYSSSSDNQLTWSTNTGAAGSCKVYAEEFFYPEISLGDINEDSSVDVIDIVMIVAYITNTGPCLIIRLQTEMLT